MRSGQGNPDEARAARYILKDYVNAKLLFCHPPPDTEEGSFNEKTRRLMLLRTAGKKKAPTTRVGKDSDTFVLPADVASIKPVNDRGSNIIDSDFFGHNFSSSHLIIQGHNRTGQNFSRAKFYPHQNIMADDGSSLGFKNARLASILGNAGSGNKKHKKMKRVKQRSGKGYD